MVVIFAGQNLSNFSLVFWSKRSFQKDILKLTDLYHPHGKISSVFIFIVFHVSKYIIFEQILTFLNNVHRRRVKAQICAHFIPSKIWYGVMIKTHARKRYIIFCLSHFEFRKNVVQLDFSSPLSRSLFQSSWLSHGGRKRHLRQPIHSKELTKLVILPDYKRPWLLCSLVKNWTLDIGLKLKFLDDFSHTA